MKRKSGKNYVLSFLVVAFATASLASCKKEDKQDNRPTSEKIAGKWEYVSSYMHVKEGEVDHRDTSMAAVGDYVEFQPGGIVKTHIAGDGELEEMTMAYFFPNDQTVSMVGESDTTTFSIKTLTSNSLVLYSKKEEDNFLDEMTVNLKK